jgi:UDP-N-acetylglucosamine diphosphorylase/glucosamine-1-phosphate N-acetyltransferase
LVEDDRVADLEPLTLTRPAFALILGSGTLGEKVARAFELRRDDAGLGVLMRSHLAAVVGEQAPGMAVNDGDWLAQGPVIVANARWVPPVNFRAPDHGGLWVGFCEGEPACASVGVDQAQGLELGGVEGWFEEVASEIRRVEVGGEWIRRPWDLVARNAEHLARDFEAAGRVGPGSRDPGTFTLVGPSNRLSVHETARIDPYTVFDTTGGPITIGPGVIVQPFSRIEGPCFIGRDTQLFRANLRGGVTLGPNCRIGGEVEQSIVQGHSNKYHEGFLGHAYIGEWVNLGAITSNSDLRNDYGEVCVPLGGDPIPTGQSKVGCFIGDHSRTGMGTMLNTGTSIGVMCNILPAGMLSPKHVPSFTSVLYGRVSPGFEMGRLLATARTVNERRGRTFTAAQEQLYKDLIDRTRLERERALQKAKSRDDGWAVKSLNAAWV